ncbi:MULTISPECIES: EcsC family protein [unclassified Duganella]|uniref:EcsC family protein n=1 Tax=unclassified Duganella TaxID=2636909 RepID=UPI00088CC8E7|nr:MULTISPECIES: EcsC family protein [unclassified Duganella]SDG64208.1 EcsC protein family protein [Duganella sp. OV458]SDJ89202.1 EcsC protein family protein [Duganella sp. OV510]
MNAKELQDLENAVKLLTATPVLIRMSNAVGSTIEAGMKKLPAKVRDGIQDATHKGLTKAIEWAGKSLDGKVQDASTRRHMLAAATTGAIGGFFGFAGLAIEIPATTMLMMRSILDIARSEGHDITDPVIQLECLSVFSHGSSSTQSDDATDTSYYTARVALAETMAETAKALSKLAAEKAAKGISQGVSASTAGKWMARFIDAVATRFGIVITEKAALQAAPLLGALTGATINSLFMDFYQDVARGHFTVLRLEKLYGQETVKTRFEALAP